MPFISNKRIYVDANDSIVDEGDPRAARLLVGEGGVLSDEEAARYGLSDVEEAPGPYDAVADHEAKHGDETEAEAEAKRQAMLAGQDGSPVEGERDEKAARPRANKARQSAPEDK